MNSALFFFLLTLRLQFNCNYTLLKIAKNFVVIASNFFCLRNVILIEYKLFFEQFILFEIIKFQWINSTSFSQLKVFVLKNFSSAQKIVLHSWEFSHLLKLDFSFLFFFTLYSWRFHLKTFQSVSHLMMMMMSRIICCCCHL